MTGLIGLSVLGLLLCAIFGCVVLDSIRDSLERIAVMLEREHVR